MKILFDLLHPADVNLFKGTMYALTRVGHEIYIMYRERGVLAKIVANELSDFPIIKIGNHRRGLLRKIYGGIQRDLKCLPFLKSTGIDVVICQGIACGIACKLLGIKIIHFDDDNEYRLTYLLGKYLSDVDIVPEFLGVRGKNIISFNGVKELAYLHPTIFKPDNGVLKDLGLEEYSYVFVREIASISLNYKEDFNLLGTILDLLTGMNLKVVLSIEDKTKIQEYPENVILLKEPVNSLHYLLFFAKFVISSGDTMAREASTSGTPCIYTGGREMRSNQYFVSSQMMFCLNEPEKVIAKIKELNCINSSHESRLIWREKISKELESPERLFMESIRRFER